MTCYRCGCGVAEKAAPAGRRPSRLGSGRAPRPPKAHTRAGGRQITTQHLLLIGLVVLLVAAAGVGLMIKFRGGGSDETAAANQQQHSAISAPINKAKDLTVQSNTRLIRMGIDAYVAENGTAPDPAQVSATGAVGQMAGQWPENPFTRQPVKNSSSPGDFTYQVTGGGSGYQLVGYGADGQPVATTP